MLVKVRQNMLVTVPGLPDSEVYRSLTLCKAVVREVRKICDRTAQNCTETHGIF